MQGRQQASCSVHYTTSCKQSSAPEYWRNYRPKHVELIEFTNKLLLLHLVGCLYYCIRDTRSHKHQIYFHFELCWYEASSVCPYEEKIWCLRVTCLRERH